MTNLNALPPSKGAHPELATGQTQKLKEAAKNLEASFLAEMLKAAGVGKTRESFGGGAGEEHFASFLAEAHAKNLVERGGIGLAESIFNALKEKHDAQTQSE